VAVKPVAGPPVLRDLLREHFLGCAAVLVAGDHAPADAPRLDPAGDGWAVTTATEARTYDTGALAARLRSPRPW
jgi:hypothetical protein